MRGLETTQTSRWHPFSYHGVEKKDGRKVEKLPFCLHTRLFPMVLALTLMNDAAKLSLFLPLLLFILIGCWRCV